MSSDHSGRLLVSQGVTCVAPGVSINGGVIVQPGASLVVHDGAEVNGRLQADGAEVIHLFGARINGDSYIKGTTDDVIVAGSHFYGDLEVSDNTGYVTTILSGATREYGIVLIGNKVTQDLHCTGNHPHVENFDVPNQVNGSRSGDCSDV